MYCQGPIEFDLSDFERLGETATERLGQKVACPHCGKETILSVLKQQPAPAAAPGSVLPASLRNCEDCGDRISRRALMCPGCGCATGVRFRFVWDVMCHIALATLIFAFIGWLLAVLGIGAVLSWRP